MLKVGMCILIDTRTMLPPRSTGNLLVWFLPSPRCAASGHAWYLSGTIHSLHRDLSLDSARQVMVFSPSVSLCCLSVSAQPYWVSTGRCATMPGSECGVLRTL